MSLDVACPASGAGHSISVDRMNPEGACDYCGRSTKEIEVVETVANYKPVFTDGQYVGVIVVRRNVADIMSYQLLEECFDNMNESVDRMPKSDINCAYIYEMGKNGGHSRVVELIDFQP